MSCNLCESNNRSAITVNGVSICHECLRFLQHIAKCNGRSQIDEVEYQTKLLAENKVIETNLESAKKKATEYRDKKFWDKEGKFDYEIQLPSIAKAAEKVVEFINITDEKVVIEYLAKSNQKALERLKRLIEEALKTHQPTNIFL